MAICEVSTMPQGVVVKLTGDIGMVEIGPFNAKLAELAPVAGPLVVFDLTRLTMLASSGMGALVAFRRAVAKGGGVVRLAAVNRLVQEAMKRAALHKLFEMHGTVAEALEAPLPSTTPG
jgi:anti-anti-sigma factor